MTAVFNAAGFLLGNRVNFVAIMPAVFNVGQVVGCLTRFENSGATMHAR